MLDLETMGKTDGAMVQHLIMLFFGSIIMIDAIEL